MLKKLFVAAWLVLSLSLATMAAVSATVSVYYELARRRLSVPDWATTSTWFSFAAFVISLVYIVAFIHNDGWARKGKDAHHDEASTKPA